MKTAPTLIVMLALAVMFGLSLRILAEYSRGLPVYHFTIVDMWSDFIPSLIIALIAMTVILWEYQKTLKASS